MSGIKETTIVRKHRFVTPCTCDTRHQWGCEVWKRGTKGRPYWITICVGTKEYCIEQAKNERIILLKCRGCGKELLREYDL